MTPTPTHLIAGQTGADVLGPPLAGLVGHVGVGDLPADDGHHVRLARGNDVVGIVGRADVALGLNAGILDDLFDGLRVRRTELVLVKDRRHQAGEVEVAAGADADVVNLTGTATALNNRLMTAVRDRNCFARSAAA